ncbi:MAG: hypothetical protein PHU65_08845 [Actinomycetota bacterium]|nr:hypothetical protein [Actinomycetota bacterium]
MIILDKINLEIPENIGVDFLTKLMGGRLNPQIEKLLAEKKPECIKNLEPKTIYSNFEIEKTEGDRVYFTSGNIFAGPNISKILKGSKTATIFMNTLGSKIDEIIKNVNNAGDFLATIVMDAVTTELLSLLGSYTAAIIKKEGIKEKGWGSTCNYSPGQYKWTIEEQKEIFSMIDGSKIGVKLNESCLMVPFKSSSGVYGFGPIDKIDKTRVACDICPRKDCIGRR